MMKKIYAFLLAFSLALTITACGNTDNYNGEDIELLEPVGVTQDAVAASYRDLKNISTYAGKVLPTVTEVSFDTNQNFKKYGALPGTDVKKGDALAYGSTDSLDKEIENLTESMTKARDSYVEFIDDSNKSMEDIEWNLDYYGKIVDNFESMDETAQANYNNYAFEYQKYKAIYAGYVASKQKLEQSIKETTELYDLDYEYNKLSLTNLKKKRNNVLATSGINGTVVSMNYYDNNAYIKKDIPVGAVGDFNNLIIKTEQVYKSDIKRAVDYYVVANGKRYEVEYVEPEDGTATAVLTDSSARYSTFKFSDPNGEIKAGDYVIVVLVKTDIKDALCVPSTSIDSDDEGSLVYVLKDGVSTSVHIRTGIKSGLYTEVLSGLSEGDMVVSDFKVEHTQSTTVIEKGSVSSKFKDTGYLYYPKSENIVNPVEHGTTYVTSIDVKRYERVTKGQTIATVYVKADSINIKRLERQILRANEDLQELMKDEKKNEKSIKYKNEAIAELNKKLSEIKADSKVTKIKAPFDGIITSVSSYKEGDILRYDAFVANIASEENCFVIVEDEQGQLTAGNEALIEYKDAENVAQSAIGQVVTVAPSALSDDLKTGYALIRVGADDMAKMSEVNKGLDGWWMRSSYSVSVVIKAMDNLLLVPKKAVTVKDGITYVTVKDEKGNYVYKNFISIGSDSSDYWCIEGLSEGETICLD